MNNGEVEVPAAKFLAALIEMLEKDDHGRWIMEAAKWRALVMAAEEPDPQLTFDTAPTAPTDITQ